MIHMSEYMSGFGNHFESESVPGTLPAGRNSPQVVAKGLYAEQLSGTAFTAPKSENKKIWFYRIRPSVLHSEFEETKGYHFETAAMGTRVPNPTQMRWDAMKEPATKTDFLHGLRTFVLNGSPESQTGMAIFLYSANQSMDGTYFYSSDGEWMIVPEKGKLVIHTECGVIEIAPTEIAVIPRGMKFSVDLVDGFSRGYVCENYGQAFRTPDLGPIGANGLAAARDFLSPVARYEDKKGFFKLVNKFYGRVFTSQLEHSPLDVVAWHGNYVPYKYDLKKFNTIGTVSFDHPDPSIFTVLTSPSGQPGVANCDFVIFPPRWMVGEDTFRPPYYHRNVMSEFMGLIKGVYDAKEEGFVPGGSSLHNCMSAHGPDEQVFTKASEADLKPMKIENTLAFMWESCYPFVTSDYAVNGGLRQIDYLSCWKSLKGQFKK
ncbi:MAG: homogentisate 1,2-dioxygenase [Xanthomonadaceae bacterium]|nr:homogentisate 1,2-dioxygenase [Xanthomonadaceae bacterium]